MVRVPVLLGTKKNVFSLSIYSLVLAGIPFGLRIWPLQVRQMTLLVISPLQRARQQSKQVEPSTCEVLPCAVPRVLLPSDDV